MEFSEKGLAEDAARLRSPRAGPAARAAGGSRRRRWFELASELDGDPAQWTQAVDAYRRVTTLAPDHAAAWNNLGLLQHRMGRYEDARRHYEVALAADPTLRRGGLQPRARCTRTWADLRRRRSGTAARSRSAPTTPTRTSTSPPRSSGQGDGATARRHWARYLELDPDSRWAEIARELDERRAGP